MNILHINQSNISGRAVLAGYRLPQGLLDQGFDSRLSYLFAPGVKLAEVFRRNVASIIKEESN